MTRVPTKNMALSYFAKELWIKYAVAIAVMTLRFGARLYTPGWRNFDGTDFWCAVSTALYTIVSSCDYILSTCMCIAGTRDLGDL